MARPRIALSSRLQCQHPATEPAEEPGFKCTVLSDPARVEETVSRQETVTNPSANFVRQLRQTGARVSAGGPGDLGPHGERPGSPSCPGSYYMEIPGGLSLVPRR